MLDALHQFIPLQSGQAAFLKEQDLINDLLGIVGYEVRDNYIVFTEDITATKNVSAVDVQLVVMDFDHYDEYDLLPLSPDQATACIQEVYAALLQTPPPDKRVDSTRTEEPQQRR